METIARYVMDELQPGILANHRLPICSLVYLVTPSLLASIITQYLHSDAHITVYLPSQHFDKKVTFKSCF